MSNIIKYLFCLGIMCVSAFAQLSIHLDGTDVSESNADSSGSLGIGVYLNEGDSCFGHTLLIKVSQGSVNAENMEVEIDFAINTSVIGASSGSMVRISGGTLFGDAPVGPGYIADNIVYDFEGATGDVVITLEAIAGGTTLNGVALTQNTILDTVTIHHPAGNNDDDTPVWTLLCESAGRYAENGSVEYDSEVGQGDVVTVVAMPDEGYRVQRWQGVDGREPGNEQEVTIKKDNQRVRVYFEPIPESKVTKAMFKAGKSRGLDSFTISGVLGMSYDDIEEGASLLVEILNDEDELLFSEELAADAEGMRVNWPVGFSYMNKNMDDGHLNMVKYSFKTGALSLGAVKQDLSGWYSPLTLRVSLGAASAEVVMYDGDDEEGTDVINGRGYMPGVFMAGLTDAVTVDSYSDKAKVDRETEMELYSGFVKGRVVTAGDAATVTGFTVMTGGYTSEVLPLTKAKKGNKYTFKRAKGEDGPDSPISSATFDFDTCTYMVRYTKGDFGDIEDREFELEFSWNEE